MSAMGYMSADVPVELILASGAMPVRLQGVPGMQTPNADRYLERAFSAEVRSITERWLTGALDFLDGVIFPRTSDSAQRLYYYLCELQRTGACGGPRPLLFDLAKIRRHSSREHSIRAVRALAAGLGVDEQQLPNGSRRFSQRAHLAKALIALRCNERPPAGSWAHRLLREASSDWTEGFDARLKQQLAAPVRLESKHRLLLVGSAPPDERFHEAVEAAGSTIVGELYDAEPQWFTAEVQSFEALGTRYYESALGSRAFVDAAEQLIEKTKSLRADGVILWLTEEEEALVWELPAQRRALAEAQIPALVLTRQAWAADASVLSRVTHFARTLEEQR